MLNSLRARLIMSHTLVLLIVGPLVGLALIYLVETQVVIQRLSEDLGEQAQVLALVASADLNAFQNEQEAQAFVTRFAQPLSAHVSLFDSQGHEIASTGQLDQPPDLTPLLTGKLGIMFHNGSLPTAEVADVLVPVTVNGQVVGVVRLTHPMENVVVNFNRLRTVIVSVLLGGLVLGAVVGWVLALNLERPITSLTVAVQDMAADRVPEAIPEKGPRELRLLARSFNSLNEQLRSLESARRKLLANLVHELGRPLGALLAATQAMQSGAAEDIDLRGELLRGMQDEIGRLRRLLEDLAQLYDRLLGSLELERRALRLDTWLPEMLAPWRVAAQEKGLKWEAHIMPMLPIIQADADRLAQVIGNLLSNAIKYTPSGGTVSVTARVEDSTLRLTVDDTGVGIAPEEQQRVFEPFHRAQAGKRFPQGMGLGLSIAHEIATAHGGQLALERSAPGGSRFALSLPLSAAGGERRV